jgi:hypothetical protein
MKPRSDATLYDVLEDALKKSPEPLDCQTLYEMTEVRKYASSPNRVSDYLGNMWRKGDVLRLPAPRLENTRARWLYTWKKKSTKKEPIDMSKAIEFNPTVDALLNRPGVEITEEGKNLVITLPHVTITIRQRD